MTRTIRPRVSGEALSQMLRSKGMGGRSRWHPIKNRRASRMPKHIGRFASGLMCVIPSIGRQKHDAAGVLKTKPKGCRRSRSEK